MMDNKPSKPQDHSGKIEFPDINAEDTLIFQPGSSLGRQRNDVSPVDRSELLISESTERIAGYPPIAEGVFSAESLKNLLDILKSNSGSFAITKDEVEMNTLGSMEYTSLIQKIEEIVEAKFDQKNWLYVLRGQQIPNLILERTNQQKINFKRKLAELIDKISLQEWQSYKSNQ